MQRARLSPVIGLLVAICGFPPPQSVAQAQSDPALEQKLQAGRNALGSRQWIVAIRAFQEASHEAPGPCAECYLGLAAAYSGQYRDTDKKLVNLFTVRAYPTYLVIDGDGVITNRIIGNFSVIRNL